MTCRGFMVLLVIAAIGEDMSYSLAGYRLKSFLISAVVGFISAYVGMWLAIALGLPEFLVPIGAYIW